MTLFGIERRSNVHVLAPRLASLDVCFLHLARVVLVILQTSQIGSFGMVRGHVVISSWFGWCLPFSCGAFLFRFGVRVSSHIGFCCGEIFEPLLHRGLSPPQLTGE